MAVIHRTYGEDGVVKIEDFKFVLFTLEKGAHTFHIEIQNLAAKASMTDVIARFIRADGRTIHIRGSISYGTNAEVKYASITLPEPCYEVPGKFDLSIFVSDDLYENEIDALNYRVCVYACTGSVDRTTSDDVISQEEYPTSTLEELTESIRATAMSSALVAAFARNIGLIESEIQIFQDTVDGITEALAARGIWAIRPNLLNKDAWWVNNGSVNLVCGDAARYSKSGGAYMKSITGYQFYTIEPTQEQTAGATYVYHREADANAGISEAWYVYRDADDGITTDCVTLTGNNIITEDDGEVYDKALQYSIVENTAWGNMETLYYPQGISSRSYKQGDTFKSYGYLIDDMQVGEIYTISCWARITSGSEAWLRFGWGGLHFNGMTYPADMTGRSDVIKVTGSDWQRVTWSFIFNPTGAEYTETTESVTENNETYTKVTRTYNWNKRVIIGVHRKYTAILQLTGFRLTHGGLYGSDTIDTLQAHIDLQNQVISDLTARVEALENQ